MARRIKPAGDDLLGLLGKSPDGTPAASQLSNTAIQNLIASDLAAIVKGEAPKYLTPELRADIATKEVAADPKKYFDDRYIADQVTARTAELNAAKDAAVAEKATLDDRLGALTREFADYKASESARAAELSGTISSLTAERNNLLRLKEEYQATAETNTAELERARGDIQGLTTRNGTLSQELETAGGQLAEARARFAEIQERYNADVAAARNAEDISGYERARGELLPLVEVANNKVSELDASVAKLTQELADNAEQLKLRSETLAAAEKNLQVARDALAAKEKALGESQAALSQATVDLQGRFTEEQYRARLENDGFRIFSPQEFANYEARKLAEARTGYVLGTRVADMITEATRQLKETNAGLVNEKGELEKTLGTLREELQGIKASYQGKSALSESEIEDQVRTRIAADPRKYLADLPAETVEALVRVELAKEGNLEKYAGVYAREVATRDNQALAQEADRLNAEVRERDEKLSRVQTEYQQYRGEEQQRIADATRSLETEVARLKANLEQAARNDNVLRAQIGSLTDMNRDLDLLAKAKIAEIAGYEQRISSMYTEDQVNERAAGILTIIRNAVADPLYLTAKGNAKALTELVAHTVYEYVLAKTKVDDEKANWALAEHILANYAGIFEELEGRNLTFDAYKAKLKADGYHVLTQKKLTEIIKENLEKKLAGYVKKEEADAQVKAAVLPYSTMVLELNAAIRDLKLELAAKYTEKELLDKLTQDGKIVGTPQEVAAAIAGRVKEVSSIGDIILNVVVDGRYSDAKRKYDATKKVSEDGDAEALKGLVAEYISRSSLASSADDYKTKDEANWYKAIEIIETYTRLFDVFKDGAAGRDDVVKTLEASLLSMSADLEKLKVIWQEQADELYASKILERAVANPGYEAAKAQFEAENQEELKRLIAALVWDSEEGDKAETEEGMKNNWYKAEKIFAKYKEIIQSHEELILPIKAEARVLEAKNADLEARLNSAEEIARYQAAVRKGIELIDKGDYSRAANILALAHMTKPADTYVTFCFGLTLLKVDKRQDANELLNHVGEELSTATGAKDLESYANLLSRVNEPQAAAGFYQRLAELHAKNENPNGAVRAFYSAGEQLMRSRDYDDAIRAFTTAINSSGDRLDNPAQAWYLIGVAHRQRSREEDARAAFKTALRFEPGHDAAYRALKPLRAAGKDLGRAVSNYFRGR